MATVGFIGLGHMGSAIARRLCDAGTSLIVFDIDPAALHGFSGANVAVATRACEVADKAEIVFACLPSREASLMVAREVASGSGAKILVEMSTIGDPTIKAIADIVSASGIVLVDAPVSGGPTGARAGTLTTMVAGPRGAIAQVRPLLDRIARTVLIVGERPGLAQICKIINNAISLTSLVVSSEAVVVGVKAGVDPTTLIDAINASTGRSSATAEKIPKAVLTRSFDYGAPIGGGLKDLELYLDLAKTQDLPVLAVSNAVQLWRYAVGRLGPGEDFTAFIKCLEEWTGVEVRGRGNSEVHD